MAEENTGTARLSKSHISIVGLGLMGGSLAMALQSKPAKIVAVDVDPEVLENALDLGIIDTATVDFATGVKDADLIILATPVSLIAKLLAELAVVRPDGCAVIDLGSTKGGISFLMEQLPMQFSAIGGHPMCGREQSGLQAASADLYQDQSFVLCRNKRTTADIERLVLDIIQAIGAQPLFLSPSNHDAIVAATSHLPYVLSSMLMYCVSALAMNNDLYWKVSATGLRDTTRLAGSDPNMMLDILLSNRKEVLSQLLNYRQELTNLIDFIEDNDQIALSSWISHVHHQQQLYHRLRWHDFGTDVHN